MKLEDKLEFTLTLLRILQENKSITTETIMKAIDIFDLVKDLDLCVMVVPLDSETNHVRIEIYKHDMNMYQRLIAMFSDEQDYIYMHLTPMCESHDFSLTQFKNCLKRFVEA